MSCGFNRMDTNVHPSAAACRCCHVPFILCYLLLLAGQPNQHPTPVQAAAAAQKRDVSLLISVGRISDPLDRRPVLSFLPPVQEVGRAQEGKRKEMMMI